MKTRLLSSFTALVVLFLLIPLASKAQTVTTTLLSESFTQDESFPPEGWSANELGENSSYGGWYESGGGNGGSYGSYGSAIANDFYAEQTACYGGTYGTISLTAPSLTTSGSPADSQYVDFDLWFPYNYYEYYYNPYQEVCIEVKAGTTALDTISSLNTNLQWSDINYAYNDPVDGYTDPSYWMHYHIPLPTGLTSQSVSFNVMPFYNGKPGGSYCYIGDMFVDNIAFTNVVITNVHNPILKVVGPTTINFGQVPVGLSAGPYYSVLSNPNASGMITLSNYAIAGLDPGDFTITRAPTSIPAGGKDSVGILYSPQTAGSRSATLNFNSNALPSSVSINLVGTGLVPAVSYSSNAMFRGVSTEVTDTSGIQYLYVNSVGGAPLSITKVSFYGLDARAYFITHQPHGLIPVGGVDSIGVRFVPDLEGQPDAHMVVATNAPINIPFDTLGLFGVGILPHLAIDSGKSFPLPTTINFDSVKLGTDTCLQITLTNPGSDTIAIEKNYFQSADYDFSITPIAGRDTLIAPGGSQQIQVCFTPLQQGHREAEIRIITDIPHTETTPPQDTSSFIVNIIGIGVPTGKLMLTGSTKKDSAFIGKTVTVTDTFWNTGDAALTVTTVNISGTNAGDFTAHYPTLPFTIASNSNQPFTVSATPSVLGAETALLTATGTSSETPVSTTLVLGVFGESNADTAIVAQPFLAESCGSDTEIITITNQGNLPETYQGSIPSNPNFTLLGSGTTPLTPGGGVDTFKVMFTPTSSSPVTGTLNFVSSGSALPSITLTASGGAAVITGSGNAPMTFPGQTSAAFPVTITNNGSCPWTPGAGQTVSDLAFTYQSGGTTPIAGSGGTAVEMFTYSPTIPGGDNGSVSFPGATGTASSINVTITAGTDDVSATSSNGFSLEQNYPNPFNETSQCEITLPVACVVHLSVINVEGQVVQTLLNQHYDAGSFEVTLDASGLASGTYYYQMTAGNVTLTKQMVILK